VEPDKALSDGPQSATEWHQRQHPFFRICNAKKQRYAAFVLWQPPNAVNLEGFSEKMCIEALFFGKSVFLRSKNHGKSVFFRC
jgi:hypothetical protein